MTAAGLQAQATTAQAITQSAMDPSYVAGYNAGYPLGRQDNASGAAANAHKFSAYQEAAGDTRAAFQSGFDDGYADGFAGRPSSIGGTSAQATAATTARAYRKGYNNGQTDANRNAADNPAVSDADAGADAADTTVFAKAYTTGYDDGYHHRLYNTAMGGRQYIDPAQADGAQSGANDLPTDPERLRARDSGVYDNGLLIAEGTRIQTTLNRALNTKTTQVGEPFTLTVTVPVWVGAIAAIPAGSTIQGTVENVTRGGKVSGAAQFQLRYNTLTLPGQVPVDLHATTEAVGAAAQNVNANEGTVSGQSSGAGKRAATDAAIGGAVGGIFGGMGGLMRGGIAGAAIGGAGAIISHKKDIELRTGEAVNVRLDRPLELPKAGQ
jgi:hypothetical protein